MKAIIYFLRRLMILSSILVLTTTIKSQTGNSLRVKIPPELPGKGKTEDNTLRKYRMTADYINRDLYGKFTSRMRVTGEYTCGGNTDSVSWNNVYISGSQAFDGPYPEGVRQEYMDNFTYVPSSEMLKSDAFRKFPSNAENIFSRNLIWDMFSFEIFAWKYYDSLRLNVPYIEPQLSEAFDMAEIGNYLHNKVILTWRGVTLVDNKPCAIIDFNAPDNIIEIDIPEVKTKGTEQYWGTVIISLESRVIEKGVMYGGTFQEIEVKAMKQKLLMKTIRELEVARIR